MSSISIAQANPVRYYSGSNRRLGHRLVLYILLFSSIVTFFSTAWQLYREYSRDVNDIDSRLSQIEHSYLNSITLSLWTMDYEQLRAQLEGIQALPDMHYLKVTTDAGTLMAVGDDNAARQLKRAFPLTKRYRDRDLPLGTLHVSASLDDVYKRLYDRVLVVFGAQAVKTFLVATFIFFLFQYLITRHLQSISRYVRSRRLGDSAEPLVLYRKENDPDNPDELDDVVQAFNQMCGHLERSYRSLALSEERFDLAMRGTNDGLWDWEIDKNQVYYSPRCAEILGFDPDPLGAGPGAWDDYVHENDREGLRQSLIRHLSGSDRTLKFVFRTKGESDRVHWVLCRGQALRDGEGHAYRLVGTLMDITAKKEAEAALAAAMQQLQEEQEKHAKAQRFACIGELSASIAHEIRNPLATILNSLALLGMDDLSAGDRKRVVDIVNHETQYLQRVLNDFLDFSRIDRSAPEVADVVETIRNTGASLATILPTDRRIDISLQNDVTPCLAYFDVDQIHRVIWNLALNGIQAMPKGGTLRIECSSEQDGVRVCVSDTGHGIPADMRGDVVKPFFTNREDGTGLGLSIVQRILEQHGSEMVIESSGEAGTRICFRLQRGQAS